MSNSFRFNGSLNREADILKQRDQATADRIQRIEAFKLQKELNEQRKRDIEELSKYEKELKYQDLKGYKEESKEVLKDLLQEAKDNWGTILGSTLSSLQSSLSKQLDSTIDNYIDNYQSMMASLVGANKDWEQITDNLNNALSSNSLIKQEDVYKNLTNLVKAGISENVEQRAFLETISSDLNLLLNTQDGSLARLIRIQDASIAENRLAIQYSLREFLNKNYETSEYIKDAYTTVANSISELQAISDTKLSSSIESAVQTWLGSYYSSGVSSNTISSLAQAINNLGTGDLSSIDSNISKLVMMGAANSGRSYGSLLTNGVTAEDISAIMTGITEYAQSITGNNVVRSQWAKMFGLSISDLEALKDFSYKKNESSVSSDINKLFNAYAELVPTTVGLKNTFENMMFTTGTNIASNDALYGTYFITDLLEKSGIGNALKDLGNSVASMGAKKTGGALQIAGTAINYSKLIPYLGGLLTTAFGDNLFTNLGSRNNISSAYSLLGGGTGLVAGQNAGSQVSVSTSLSDVMNPTNQVTEAAGEEPTSDEHIKEVADTTKLIYEALAGDVGNSILDVLMDIRNNMNSGSTGIGMQSSWYGQI